MPKSIILSGSTGFVGSALLPMVDEVWTLGRSSEAHAHFDLMASEKVELPGELEGGACIHLAGKAHALVDGPGEAESYFTMNTEGTRCLVAACEEVGVSSFVYVSTVKVADFLSKGFLIRGDNGGVSLDPYGESKWEAEKIVLNSKIPQVCVVRPTLVYGGRPKGNIAKMIDAVERGRFPPLPELSNRRSMMHVQDLCRALLACVDNEGVNRKVFTLSDDCPVSTSLMYEAILQALGKRRPGFTVPLGVLKVLAKFGDGIGKVRGKRFLIDSDSLDKLLGDSFVDTRKDWGLLGLRPERTFVESVSEMVERRGEGCKGPKF